MREVNAEVGVEVQKTIRMSEEEKKLFDQQQGQKLLDDYVEVDRRDHFRKKERAYNVPALDHVTVPQEPIQEPDLGWKGLEKKTGAKEETTKGL